MRAGTIIIVSLMLAGGRMLAQQSTAEASHAEKTPAALLSDPDAVDALVTHGLLQVGSDAVAKNHLQATGPLAEILQAPKASAVPGRVLHLINPLAKGAPNPEAESARDLNPRAWSTIAGWNPGSSAFANPVTHESSLGLLAVRRSR
jgi:hypothetical protein